jgi:hypothetical protein
MFAAQPKLPIDPQQILLDGVKGAPLLVLKMILDNWPISLAIAATLAALIYLKHQQRASRQTDDRRFPPTRGRST